MFNTQKIQEPKYTVGPSQWMNIGWLILIPIAYYFHRYACAASVVMYIYKYFEVDCWRYEFYEDCVIERKGVFSVTRETVNYFRIKSIMVDEPFWMRILGLSIVKVMTSEQYKPSVILHAIPHGENIQSYLQECAKVERRNMGIRDLDVYNTHL